MPARHILIWLFGLAIVGDGWAQLDRDWKIFVVPFSHTDVGFTAPVPEVIQLHSAYLDTVIAFVERTTANPDNSRFRWVIEIPWVLEDYLETRSPEQIDRLMGHVRDGRIEIGAQHFGLQTDLTGPEELVRSLYFSAELRAAYDVPVRTAVINDTPGFTWSLAQLLPKTGVPYLSLAMNSFLSDFYTTTDIPNLFWWEAQSGDRTLVWRSIHPEWAYLEGRVWRVYGPYSIMETAMTAQLNNLATAGYPYDVVLINAATGDNGAPELSIVDNAREWNERHSGSTMRVATFSEFFDYVVNNMTGEIPVLSGDAPNWWSWSFASSATGGFLQSRSVQMLLPAAETMAAVADALVPGYYYRAEDLRRAYINNLLFEDHNLGSINTEEEEQFWERKMGWIGAAHGTASSVMNESVDALSGALTTGPSITIAVLNPTAWWRSETVYFSSTEGLIAPLLAFDIRNSETGADVDYQRLENGEVAFFAEDVPPLGYRTYEIIAHTGPVEEGGQVEGLVLENDFYRLEVDASTGGLASVFDKELARDLAKGDGRFNQYTFSGSGTPSGLSVVSSDSGAVLQRMVLEGSAPGSASYRTTVTLHADQKRIDFQNDYDKQVATVLETVDFMFDFDLPGARLQYEIPFGHVDVFDNELSGFRTKHYAMQRWSVIDGGDVSATLATRGPAIHAYPSGTFDGDVRLLTSFSSSNIAYRAGVGDLSVGFAVRSQQGTAAPEEAMKFAYAVNQPLVTRILPPGQDGVLHGPTFSFVQIDGGTLLLSTLKRPMAGEGLIARLYNPLPNPVNVNLQFGVPVENAFQTSLVETDETTLPVIDDAVAVTFGPHEVKTLRFVFGILTNADESAEPRFRLLLDRVYPNPFSRETTISYRLDETAYVRITVYDLLGRHVATLANEHRSVGPHKLRWSGVGRQGRVASSGMYVLRFEADFIQGGSEDATLLMTMIR